MILWKDETPVWDRHAAEYDRIVADLALAFHTADLSTRIDAAWRDDTRTAEPKVDAEPSPFDVWLLGGAS